MKEIKQKYNLPVVSASEYNLSPARYEIRRGSLPDAPPCPFGHRFKWVGFDKQNRAYVRLTKSVFKKLIAQLDKEYVDRHDAYFNEQ